jgi:hypothetical protein
VGSEDVADESRRDSHFYRNPKHRHTAFGELGDLVAIDDQVSSAADTALCFLKASLDALRDAFVFLLGDLSRTVSMSSPAGPGVRKCGSEKLMYSAP